jgi:hypothetical protein
MAGSATAMAVTWLGDDAVRVALLSAAAILLATILGVLIARSWWWFRVRLRVYRRFHPTVERKAWKEHAKHAAELWQVPKRRVTVEMRKAARRDLMARSWALDPERRLLQLNRYVDAGRVPPLPDTSPLVLAAELAARDPEPKP